MKKFVKIYLAAGIFSCLISLNAVPASALIVTDVITFPDPTFAVDNSSGTNPDYIYEHQVAVPMNEKWKVLSARVRLTHTGNPNEGPTREIWHLQTRDGIYIGRLSFSESGYFEDGWILPDSVIQKITLSYPWSLELALAEQTSYNSEKIQLRESRLEIECTKKAPSSPEPATMSLLAGGFLLWPITQKLRKRRKEI